MHINYWFALGFSLYWVRIVEQTETNNEKNVFAIACTYPSRRKCLHT
ncbi:hypothetical protein ALT721_1090020 [Alteromonas alvinellae]